MPKKIRVTQLDALERIRWLDAWLDENVSKEYQDQPLAQDWARISKIGEEYGEAVEAFIGYTGQSPRKGYRGTSQHVIKELLDVAATAILAVQHFTKDEDETFYLLVEHIASLVTRIKDGSQA